MAWNPLKRRPSWDGLAGKAITGTPEVIDAIRGGWVPYPLLGGGSRQRISDAYSTAQSANYSWIYRNSPAVRTVVDVIVRNIGQLDLRLYEEVSEAERQPRPDHPAALSLRYPAESVTQDQLVRGLFKDFLLYDNAYALIVSASGGQVSLFRLPAHMVEVRGRSLFEAEGYRLWMTNGDFREYDAGQVMHWRGENPDDPRIGVSRLDTLRGVIAEDAALQQAIVELANAGLTEPVWAFRPLDAPTMSAETENAFGEDLTNRLHSRNRRVVVTQEGTELRSFGVSPKDAQMFEIRRWAIERVAALYGVPLGMVGLDANLEDAQKQFYADVLPPYCEEFTKFLNQRILVRVYGWLEGCFEFNLDEKHMGDDRLKSLVSATGRPVMLTNEARAKINLPPVDGGGELVTPLNVVVGEKPSVDVMPVQDPNGPEQDGSYRVEERAIKATLPQYVAASPQRDLDAQRRHIDRSQAVIQRHLNRIERKLRGKARVAVKATDADWQRWDREFSDDLHRLVEQIVESEGDVYAFKLGGQFDMGQVANYLKAMAEGSAEAINNTIRELIDEVGIDDAMSRQTQYVPSFGAGLGSSATMWARKEAARQSPGYERRVKTWVPDTDRHAEFGGHTVPIDSDWPAGFAPGTAPGCRCTFTVQ